MKEDKKLSLRQMIIIGVFTGLGSVGGKIGYNYFTSGSISEPTSIQKTLVRIANETNKSLPMLLDQYTRLDTTIAGGENRFIYLYTLLDVDISSLNKDEFTSQMKPNLINSYKTLAAMDAFRKMDVEITYTYRSEKGVEFTSITISPKDFSEKM